MQSIKKVYKQNYEELSIVNYKDHTQKNHQQQQRTAHILSHENPQVVASSPNSPTPHTYICKSRLSTLFLWQVTVRSSNCTSLLYNDITIVGPHLPLSKPPLSLSKTSLSSLKANGCKMLVNCYSLILRTFTSATCRKQLKETV